MHTSTSPIHYRQRSATKNEAKVALKNEKYCDATADPDDGFPKEWLHFASS